MKLKITSGTTSKLARIFIQDSSATDGSGLTGLVNNSAGLTWYWIQDGDTAPTAVTPVTATVGTWSSGGFKEVDSTNMPGVYEIGIPNAAIDANGTTHMLLKGATNMAPVAIEIECDGIDYLTPIDTTVWDASASAHTVAGSFGRKLKNLGEGLVAAEGEVNDLSATTSSFVTNLAEATDDHYRDAVISFISGSLNGQSRTISAYDGTTKTVTLDQALTDAPANADEFLILTTHQYTASEIASSVLTTQMTESYATKGSQPTLAQSVYMIQQGLLERSVEDVTETVKTLSGASAATFTLDSATTPKSKVRAT